MGPCIALIRTYVVETLCWVDSAYKSYCFLEAAGVSYEGHWNSIPGYIPIELELTQKLIHYGREA